MRLVILFDKVSAAVLERHSVPVSCLSSIVLLEVAVEAID